MDNTQHTTSYAQNFNHKGNSRKSVQQIEIYTDSSDSSDSNSDQSKFFRGTINTKDPHHEKYLPN